MATGSFHCRAARPGLDARPRDSWFARHATSPKAIETHATSIESGDIRIDPWSLLDPDLPGFATKRLAPTTFRTHVV
jgi:hypothetical protein